MINTILRPFILSQGCLRYLSYQGPLATALPLASHFRRCSLAASTRPVAHTPFPFLLFILKTSAKLKNLLPVVS
ncbi:hypothetical protein HZ326_13154 [Fusarium oxysporum f. sp. albedinis]|nr:hypothetical protein HZ326_13154 [Fusarium oxysporum f. sp. albedinis]